MDPVRDRVRYVGRIGVVFGQRTELWWDHAVAATFEWKRVVWNIPQQRYDRMLSVVRELLALDDIYLTMARELSLGQRMRADLALALLHDQSCCCSTSRRWDLTSSRDARSWVSFVT